MMKIWKFSIILTMKKKQSNLLFVITIQLYNFFLINKKTIHRDRENVHDRLFNDYFSETPKYNDILFWRRYCMSGSLFLRIIHEVEGCDSYFTQRRDTMSRLGLSSIQNISSLFRMLAYGLPDEYIKIGESTTIESMITGSKSF